MGDIAEMMLEGILCEVCLEVIHDNFDDPPGYPTTCSKECRKEQDKRNKEYSRS